MKYEEVEGQLHEFLTLVLERGESSASHCSCFIPWERASSIQLTGGWADPRASLDRVMKRKILSPCQELELRTKICYYAV